MPRVDRKRKLVCVFSTELQCFEVRQITNKGLVSKVFNPQVFFTTDIKEAFRHFTVPFAKFRSVAGVDKNRYRSWNEYIQGVWAKSNKDTKSLAEMQGFFIASTLSQ